MRNAERTVTRSFSWRHLARILHRDLGYFFFGVTVVYAISGLALNHKDHWNPSYSVVRERFVAPEEFSRGDLSEQQARALLAITGRGASDYLQHFAPDPGHWRIFFKGGAATLDRQSSKLETECLERRPFLHLFNKLHYNPGAWWRWFSDAFSVSLIVISITGVLLLRGHHGITRRGGLLALAGLFVPGILILSYL